MRRSCKHTCVCVPHEAQNSNGSSCLSVTNVCNRRDGWDAESSRPKSSACSSLTHGWARPTLRCRMYPHVAQTLHPSAGAHTHSCGGGEGRGILAPRLRSLLLLARGHLTGSYRVIALPFAYVASGSQCNTEAEISLGDASVSRSGIVRREV